MKSHGADFNYMFWFKQVVW